MLNRNTLIGAAVAYTLMAAQAEGAGVTDLDDARESANADATDTDETKAQRKARLAAAEAQAKKIAEDGTMLPDELVGLAQREIKECWKEFANKGGVWDLRLKVKGKLSNISKHILNIAKECAIAASTRGAGDPDYDYIKVAGRMFRNAMAQAENSLRGTLDFTDDEAEAKLDSFLSGSWNVYKSQVKTSFDSGLDPKDFDTIYKLNEAAKEAKKQKNGGGAGKGRAEADSDEDEGDEDEGSEDRDTPPETQIADYVVNTQYAKAHGALVLMLRTLGTCSFDKHEDRIAGILNVACKELAKLTLPAKQGEQVQQAPIAQASEA